MLYHWKTKTDAKLLFNVKVVVNVHSKAKNRKVKLSASLNRYIKPLFSVSLQQAMLLSRDGQYLLTGGDGGVVSVWQVHNLKQLFTYPGCDAGIRSMAMSHDQR